MSSIVDVVNRGLLAIGASPIVSLDDETTAARTAKALWPLLRDEVLRKHPWNSAKARAELAAEVTAPAFGWAYSYAWPADCLRVLAVNDDVWPSDGWECEGRKILCDYASPIRVEYVRREEDVNLWDAELQAAVALKLAEAMAPKLTQQSGVQDRIEKKAQDTLLEAKVTDGLEHDVVEDDLEDPWLSVRF